MLKRAALKAVSLVGFPLMNIVAIFHGIFIALRLVWKHLGKVILFPFAAASVARKASSQEIEKENGDAVAPWVFCGLYLVGFALTCLIGAKSPRWIDDGSGSGYGTVYGYSWFRDNYKIFLGIAATNVFFILYELGRCYWDWLHRDKKVEAESEEVGFVTADDFNSMDEKIRGMEPIYTEQSNALYQEITDLLKKGKINLNEACGLKQMVDNGYKNTLQRSVVDSV